MTNVVLAKNPSFSIKEDALLKVVWHTSKTDVANVLTLIKSILNISVKFHTVCPTKVENVLDAQKDMLFQDNTSASCKTNTV